MKLSTLHDMGMKQHKKDIQGNYKMLSLYIGFILAIEDGWENESHMCKQSESFCSYVNRNDNHMKVFSH
jgi:hypothetical protein